MDKKKDAFLMHLFSQMVRLSTLDLNILKTASKHRSAILRKNINLDEIIVNPAESRPLDDDSKTVHYLTQRPKLLTATEKDELEIKYKNGMTMVALADEYKCHYTTVGRILRKRGIEIRTPCSY